MKGIWWTMRVGKTLGFSAILLLVGSGFGLNRASATDLTMTVNGVAPGSGNVGVIDWTVTAADADANLLGFKTVAQGGNGNGYTYCMDTADHISGGQSVSFNFASANYYETTAIPGGSLMTATQLGEIEALYSSGLSAIGGSSAMGDTMIPNPPTWFSDSNANTEAATFQAALWDLLYGDGADGITYGNALADAIRADYANSLSTLYHFSTDDFDVLVATNGQNQGVMFLGNPPFIPPSGPLPSVASTGMMLLAGVGVFYIRRRRLGRIA